LDYNSYMHRHLASAYRITSRAGFLAFALVLGLILWYFPTLLNLDEFRPRVTSVLESTFHCRAIVGGITAQIVPSPGLVIAPVVLLESAENPVVLASVRGVRMSVAILPLLKGHIQIEAIRFGQPRFIAHRLPVPSGPARWVMLKLPNVSSTDKSVGIDAWQVRNGRIEIWDETRQPSVRWSAEQLNGDFRVREQTGAMAGKAPALGRRAVIDIHYGGSESYPVQVRLNQINVSGLRFLVPTPFVRLEGQTDLFIQSRFLPRTEIHAQMEQPTGAGLVKALIEHEASGTWRWSVLGKHTRVSGTTFESPEWSAKEDGDGLAVYARATTTEGGTAEMGLTKPRGSSTAALDVNVASVTIRQVLDIFKPGSTATPTGYQTWQIDQGSMQGLLNASTSFVVQDGDLDINGMHIDVTGTFGLGRENPLAHIQGDLQNIPVEFVVQSFFPGASPITGVGTANFDLTFPQSSDWIKGLNGTVHIDVTNGILKMLKAMYRITSVLNLGNYLRLRVPNLAAKGIEIEDLAGHLSFQNGVLSTEDLFLKSPNMNIGAKGMVDLGGRQVKVTLRLEMLRFLEDILRDVPITHWIFKKPNKIFLPLVVVLEGPWDDVEVR
jgi:hypothetical protein